MKDKELRWTFHNLVLQLFESGVLKVDEYGLRDSLKKFDGHQPCNCWEEFIEKKEREK